MLFRLFRLYVNHHDYIIRHLFCHVSTGFVGGRRTNIDAEFDDNDGQKVTIEGIEVDLVELGERSKQLLEIVKGTWVLFCYFYPHSA